MDLRLNDPSVWPLLSEGSEGWEVLSAPEGEEWVLVGEDEESPALEVAQVLVEVDADSAAEQVRGCLSVELVLHLRSPACKSAGLGAGGGWRV